MYKSATYIDGGLFWVAPDRFIEVSNGAIKFALSEMGCAARVISDSKLGWLVFAGRYFLTTGGNTNLRRNSAVFIDATDRVLSRGLPRRYECDSEKPQKV
jgi:hypothetical protein